MDPVDEPATTDDLVRPPPDRHEAPSTGQGRAALRHLPPGLQTASAWLLSRWPGRVAVNERRAFVRLDMFDRSMTIAAQFFTSVLPILILFATWAANSDSDRLADAVEHAGRVPLGPPGRGEGAGARLRHRRHPDRAGLRDQPVPGLDPRLRDHLGHSQAQEQRWARRGAGWPWCSCSRSPSSSRAPRASRSTCCRHASLAVSCRPSL